MSEEKVATNILADRLSLLERAGLIESEKDPDKKDKGIDLVRSCWKL